MDKSKLVTKQLKHLWFSKKQADVLMSLAFGKPFRMSRYKTTSGSIVVVTEVTDDIENSSTWNDKEYLGQGTWYNTYVVDKDTQFNLNQSL